MVTVFEQLSVAKSLYNKLTAPVCKAHGLTQMEFNILLFLANNPGLDTAAQIVKYRNMTKSHVSMSVKSLQEKGLIESCFQPGDRKSVHLRLCPKAETIVRDGKQAQEVFGKTLIQGFSQEEVSLMREFINRIQKNMLAGE